MSISNVRPVENSGVLYDLLNLKYNVITTDIAQAGLILFFW